jgi:hypothetical protein
MAHILPQSRRSRWWHLKRKFENAMGWTIAVTFVVGVLFAMAFFAAAPWLMVLAFAKWLFS